MNHGWFSYDTSGVLKAIYGENDEPFSEQELQALLLMRVLGIQLARLRSPGKNQRRLRTSRTGRKGLK